VHTVSEQRPAISIVVPLFNEEAGIDQLRHSLERLRQTLQTDPEFVFVDDGSADQTAALLRKHFGLDPTCRIVAHERNRGIGAATRTGFAHCQGELICTIDADCSYRPEGLKRLIDTLEQTGADIAVASPYHPEGGVEGVPGWRLLLSRGCSLLYGMVSPVRLYTYTSVFRAYRRRVVETTKFETDGFVSATEILIMAAGQGYRIVEVPMVLRARKVGQSKMKIARTIRTHLRLMWTMLRQPRGTAPAGETSQSSARA
jgi:dolichol-phosphate mannosyltransferase